MSQENAVEKFMNELDRDIDTMQIYIASSTLTGFVGLCVGHILFGVNDPTLLHDEWNTYTTIGGGIIGIGAGLALRIPSKLLEKKRRWHSISNANRP